MTIQTFLTIILIFYIAGFTAVESGNATYCHSIYGIRMSPNGSLEKVLDAARCHNANGLPAIISFLDQLKSGSIDLEIINSSLPQINSSWIPSKIRLRRLSIQHSNLSILSSDAFKGQENSLEELDLSRNELEEIPISITNLTALIRLDLSRNKIRSLSPGLMFFNLLRLRHLDLDHNNLGYLEAFKLENDTLPMSVFNLEPLRDHIESIRMVGNNLTTFPDQFSRLFSRLQILDLSRNNFKVIPPEAFSQMPQLRKLNLDDNQLKNLPEEMQLPSSIDQISIKGNQIKCDCSANWLWRLIQNDTDKLRMDDCRDDPWAGRRLSDLPEEFCLHRSGIDHSVVTHLVDVEVIPMNPETINVTFHLLDGAPSSLIVKWTMELRRFGIPEPEAIINGDLPAGSSLTRILEGLLPSTGYEICVRLPGSGHCWEVITPAEVTYPVAQVAVAASVSGTSTFIVVVLVCCYCPRFRRNKKKRSGRKNNKSAGSPQEEKKSPITFSTSINPDDSWIRQTSSTSTESNNIQRFSTFRAEQDVQETFQATCKYLKQMKNPTTMPINSTSTVYFNASYGLAAIQNKPADDSAYKYCTWRPNRIVQHEPLQRWTSYPDFLANNHHHQDDGRRRPRSALAVPVYSLVDGQGRPWPARYKRPRFYWSTAANNDVELRF